MDLYGFLKRFLFFFCLEQKTELSEEIDTVFEADGGVLDIDMIENTLVANFVLGN